MKLVNNPQPTYLTLIIKMILVRPTVVSNPWRVRRESNACGSMDHKTRHDIFVDNDDLIGSHTWRTN